ncbi:hypothetical protein L226DRAFT_548121 [Lentinus tigrinus ALCF2SS1-7]|uniref:AB hydrolase-1 domain-containing protein n=1 Tax=Lentinus tigrinus ALCF2SS1-6 TaxID=1328759 RepID=A0A5C2S8Z7_9APHY|nr:hypothetical protein L227DRAFT_502129 [Lentinus tigrinus ALCF2SS1-6]RPD69546.1 hypothetical protein L226DRAFT_548121 [Lentinus tigrinus ALCF2SS1-7]
MCAISLGGIFAGSASSVRHSSTTRHLVRQPSPSAPREAPVPLVFLYASRWDAQSQTGMQDSAAWFAERGYTCLEIDLGHPEDAKSSQALMKHYESELASHIRLLAIPFAPVIVARAGGTLIAQTYISSYPASALLLISPPPSNATLSASSSPPLPTPLPEFNFEPRFPVAVMCTENERSTLERENRLWKDPNVDKMVVRDERAVSGQEGLVKIETWLDELGF